MGRKAEQTRTSISPRDLESMEKTFEGLTSKLTDLRRKIAALEDQISHTNSELAQAKQRQNNLSLEIKTHNTQVPALTSQIKEQEKKVKQAAPDPSRLNQLKKECEVAQKDLNKAASAAAVIEEKVKKVHEEIVAKTKGRLDTAQKKLDDVTNKLDKLRQEKTKLRVAVTTAARNLKKSEEKINNMKKEIENCEKRIKRCAEEMGALDGEAAETLQALEAIEAQLEVSKFFSIVRLFQLRPHE